MENKNYLGLLLVAFLAIVVGVVLLQSAADQVAITTNTIAYNNTFGSDIVNETTQYLTDIRAIGGTIVVVNRTNGVVIGAGNYTITNNVAYNGGLAVSMKPVINNEIYAYGWRISGTAQPIGYIDDTAGRSIANLIIIFFALAIAVIAIYPTLKENFGM